MSQSRWVDCSGAQRPTKKPDAGLARGAERSPRASCNQVDPTNPRVLKNRLQIESLSIQVVPIGWPARVPPLLDVRPNDKTG